MRTNQKQQFLTMDALVSLTGWTRNRIKNVMKKNGLDNDGSPAMRYSAPEAQQVITNLQRREAQLIRKQMNAAATAPESTTVPLEIKARIAQLSDISRVKSNVVAWIPERETKLDNAYFHLGPTNSGKTYESLKKLSETYEQNPQGRYVYAGPLRMLAYEVYLKMVALHGEENVGFLTGEEQINPDAAIVACTVEMAPTQGDLLILDEAHWALQEDRGNRWTSLLISGEYGEIHVIAASEARDSLIGTVFDSELMQFTENKRRTTIAYEGEIHLKDIPEKSAVVCFSRNSVYAVAKALDGFGKKVGVLYGALPLEARKYQIEKFIKGDYDVMVTTDVIGHGINLPIDNVVFVETVKHDGISRRNLHTWEGAQIAGRAGRFGYSDHGKVYLATGLEWFTKDEAFIQECVAVAAGKAKSDLNAGKPFMAPRFGDLHLAANDTGHLLRALDEWSKKAQSHFTNSVVTPIPVTPWTDNIRSIAEHLSCPPTATEEYNDSLVKPTNTWNMPVHSLWSLISIPISPNGMVQLATAEWLNTGSPKALRRLLDHFVLPGLGIADIEAMEISSRMLTELRMIHLTFGDQSGIQFLNPSQLNPLLKKLSQKIIKTLPSAVKTTTAGHCVSCGYVVKPWYDLCRICELKLAA